MKTHLLKGILSLAFIYLTACQGPKENPQLPNIVLLMGDDHGWDETGYNQHPFLHTPVLDEMAASGLRMDRFYSASPVCSPTRGSIITGRHPNRYGTFAPGASIRPEEISIATLLKEAGYATGHFGKWHLGPVKAASPTNPGAMGFDEWLSHDNFFEMDPYLSRNGGEPEIYKGEGSEVVVDEAIEFIKTARKSGKPFFVVIWYGSPHEPYSGLPEDLALYDSLPIKYQEKKVRLTSNETGLPVERPQREVLRERFAEITAMDRSIGQMRDFLAAEGVRDNTLLWYFGDNGTPQEANATIPFRGEKARVYEGGIRVPSVVEWPNAITAPRVTDMHTVTSDLFPTFCEIINQPLPDRPIDGLSLMSLFNGDSSKRSETIKFWNGKARQEEGAEPRPYIDPELQKGTSPLVKLMGGIATRNFTNFHHPDIQEQDFKGPRAILGNRFKLVIDGDNSGEETTELFDIVEDPAETRDLKEEHGEIVAQMTQELRTWQQSVLQSLMEDDYR